MNQIEDNRIQIETLLQDKNVMELLGLLKQYQETNLENKVYETVNYVQNLENTLSRIMEQMTNMQQELLNVRQQNEELMVAVNHTVKDTIVENIQKVEAKVLDLHVQLDNIRQQISEKAKEIVDTVKQYGKLAFVRLTDFFHVRKGLDDIRQKAESAMNHLDAINREVEQVKNSGEVKTVKPDSYQEEMQKFMDAKVAEGIHYKSNAEAFEEFQQYYAEKHDVSVTLLCETNHVLYSDYSEVIVVGAGADSVDYKIISICHKGDIVVTQDYGVAAMALGKGVYAIHQSGKWYTNDNIGQMLMERPLNKKARMGSHKNHLKGHKKRTEKDDKRFAQSFERLVLMACTQEGEHNGICNRFERGLLPMFERIEYKVERIDGDYAYLKNESEPDNELKCVARALLPKEISEGCRLAYEMLQYSII